MPRKPWPEIPIFFAARLNVAKAGRGAREFFVSAKTA
jgi:hypothetical protein